LSEGAENASLRVFVTNFNPRFTGVSATAAGVVKQQEKVTLLSLVGKGLPDCAPPAGLLKAYSLSRLPAIWHVRRNSEMLAAIVGRDILRLPIKAVFTSSAQRLHSWVPRQLIARMDAVIATSDAAAGFVPNVRAVIPHGVDVERFRPLQRGEAGWPALGFGGARGIATVGRIRPEKGTALFVEAMIDCLPALSDVTALVVGTARPEHAGFAYDLRRRVKSAGLESRILFPGEIAPEHMPALYRALSLLIAVPRYEGYGMTALEAMASGVPFLASKAGLFTEFSEEGGGLILESTAPDTISSEVKRLLSDETLLGKMGAKARDTAISRYSVAREAEEICKVYSGLAAEKAG
jgi:mannosyltransferase